MDPLSGQCHIGGHAVEGQPQVLNVQLRVKGLREGPVEVVAGKQGSDGVGEVQQADIAAHVGEPAAAACGHEGEVPVGGPERAHESTDAHPTYPVNGNTRLNY